MIVEIPDNATLREARAHVDAAMIEHAKARAGGVKAKAARALGLTREGFYGIESRSARLARCFDGETGPYHGETP